MKRLLTVCVAREEFEGLHVADFVFMPFSCSRRLVLDDYYLPILYAHMRYPCLGRSDGDPYTIITVIGFPQDEI